jgi:hypothetical protein
MPNTIADDDLARMLRDLLRCTSDLAAVHGQSAAMRRVLNDVERIRNSVERLRIDAEGLWSAAPLRPSSRSVDVVRISDSDYDADFWRDADHEGVGAQSLACLHVTRK